MKEISSKEPWMHRSSQADSGVVVRVSQETGNRTISDIMIGTTTWANDLSLGATSGKL